MATTAAVKSLVPGQMTDEEFIAFYAGRPHGERWQLIDGDLVMMTPPRLRHLRVAGNLSMELNIHFRRRAYPLYAFHEVGLMVPGGKRFRPTADIAIVPDTVDQATIWSDQFLLAGEVLSESNSVKQVERKRQRYMQHPDNLYVLVMAQDKPSIEVWSRRANWERYDLRNPDDVLELPEWGFKTTLRVIYTGTAVTPR